MSKSPLSSEKYSEAYEYYYEWFELYPNSKNPSDVNSKEKFEFFMRSTWEKLQLMQQARKSNVERYEFPHPWTKAEYWEERRRLMR